MKVKRDWYAGLRDELETEIRLCVNAKRRAGKIGWGDGRKASKVRSHKSTVLPMFPMFARDDEREGRSLGYHAEVSEEMIIRHELGMSLWSDDEADTESFVGTELSRSEADMIDKLLTAANNTTLKSLRI